MPICDDSAERVARALALACVAAISLGACDGCDEPLATLRAHDGAVERDHAAAQEEWSDAADGDGFVVGDGIRTLDGATASLALRGGGGLDLEPRTVVRFRLPGESEPSEGGIEVVAGEATVEAGEGALSIETELGPAILETGGRARISGGERARLDVLLGRAVLDRDGEEVVVDEGDGMDVAIGPAVLDPAPEVEPPEVPPEAEPTPAPPPEPTPAGVSLVVRAAARWQPRDGAQTRLPPGDHVAAPGTRLSLSRRSRLTVRRGDERVELTGRGEFVVGGAAEPILRASSGRAAIDASGAEVALRVPGGVIVATLEDGAGTLASVQVGEAATRVRVREGRVELREEDQTRTVAAGDRATLARPERAPRPEELPAPGPARAHLVIATRGAVTVHSPRTPVVVGIPTPMCEGEAAVVAGRRGARGSGRVHLSLPRGSHSYSVRCVDAGVMGPEVATGRVRVLRDSGRASVPRTPPTSVVDADGRPYTIVYQNLLPRVVVRWMGATGPGPYRLQAGSVTRSGARARFELRSGLLREGTHAIVVTDAAGASSPRTRVTIRFDNAAPTASVRSPDDRSFAPGQTVHVAGVAQQGWRVDVDGAALPLDRQFRFEADVAAPVDRDALSIRLTHSQRGVHYYLRRVR